MPITADEMVVDHADRLHEGIDDGRSAKCKARGLERLRHLARCLRLGRHLRPRAEIVLGGAPASHVPQPLREAAALHDRKIGTRARYRSDDLGAVADNAGVGHQRGDARLVVAHDRLRLEAIEGTAEGVIVVDASIPGVSLIQQEPVRIVFEKGLAVSIEGGREATLFRDLLQSFDDPLVYNLGELGVGMNPHCSLDGTMLSDESVYGAVQLALGTSAYIGGTVKAAAHYDTIVTDAQIWLDDKLVLDGTRLYLDT